MEVDAIILQPNSWLVSFRDVAYQGLGIDLWGWQNGNPAAVVTTSALVRGSPCRFTGWMKSLWFCQRSYSVQRHNAWAWKLTRTGVRGPLLEELSHLLGCWVSPLHWVLIVGCRHRIEKAAHRVPSPINSSVRFFPRSLNFGLSKAPTNQTSHSPLLGVS